MTHRERVLTAFSRKPPDKVPKWIQPGAYLSKLLNENTGAEDPAEYFDMDIQQLVHYQSSKKQNDFSKYFLGNFGDINEWGIMKKGHKHLGPMRNFQKAEEVHEYPFPDVEASYRYKNLPEYVKKVKEKGLPAVSAYEMGVFEQTCAFREMDNFLVDLLQEPEFLIPLLERVSDLKARIAAGYAQAGVDILWTGDDLGTQNSMLMNRDLWRKNLKPCVKKIIQSAREAKSDILVAFHSDGYIEPVIPDLIEIGVDILQSVQPECMNPAELKEKYGDRLSFWGTIGAQSTMALGTPEEVKRVVKERIMTVGKGGGLCIGPSHTLESPTPWENIVAFFEAVEIFGVNE